MSLDNRNTKAQHQRNCTQRAQTVTQPRPDAIKPNSDSTLLALRRLAKEIAIKFIKPTKTPVIELRTALYKWPNQRRTQR